jgi:S-(hydroxymethyl)glutathione dehydrogenase / alcohol dehydrogenase
VKAAVCRAFGSPLGIEDLRLDPPEEGEVRVRIAACAICHSDISYAEGAWDGRLPAVYGHEAAGTVEEVGPGVRGVGTGDRVVVSLLRSCGRCFFCLRDEPYLCDSRFPADRIGRLYTKDGEPVQQAMHTGAFAEEVVVDRSQVAIVPSSIPLDSAALLACGVVTGLGAVANTADVQAGSSVVVIGTGGVGLNSVQGAVLRGAEPIVAVDVSRPKLEAAATFGATHTVDSGDDDLARKIRALTGGRGADYVFVTVGSASAIEQGLACLRRGGTLVVVGLPPSGMSFEVVAVDLAYHGRRVLGSRMGSSRLADAVPQLVELYEQGRLKLDELISARYPLEQINEAFVSARDGSTLRNVIVFDRE